MHQAHGIHLPAHHQFVVWQAEDILHEDVAQPLLAHTQLAHKLVAAAQRGLEGYLYACHHGGDARLVHICETDAGSEQELVPRVFHVMLVVCVVHYTLEVALIVAHLEGQFKGISCIFHPNGSVVSVVFVVPSCLPPRAADERR